MMRDTRSKKSRPENSRSEVMNRADHRDEATSNTKDGRSSSVKGSPLQNTKAPASHQTFNETLDEVRETMIQYKQCADPPESAAPKERMRKVEQED